MAKVLDIDEGAWNEWVATRPEIVQATCRKLPPDRLYSLQPNGHRVTLYSYSEDGTVTVNVNGECNAIMFDRRVFGINPDDLTECDIPGDDEIVGTVLTEESEIKEHIDLIRPAILAARSGADDD